MKYTCFTKEQQKKFDELSRNMRQYIIYRARGDQKKQAYLLAGYKDGKYTSQNIRVMEKRYPILQELIDAMSVHKERVDAYQEGTKVSKKIDRRAEDPPIEMQLYKVDDRMPVEQPIKDVATMSVEDAKRIKFYRQIMEGKLINEQTTITYDKDGNVTGKKVVKTLDVDTRMKARKELDRVLGLTDMLQIGNIEAGSINITIVDASKPDVGVNDKPDIEGDFVEVVDDGGTEETA